MKERFDGPDGQRVLIEALLQQRIVNGDQLLATDLAAQVEIMSIPKEEVLIEQDGEDNFICFIIAGSFRIIINGKHRATRYANNHVGEMAAIEPSQRRSASVVANEEAVVAKLTEPALAALAGKYPKIWRFLAAELSRRLYERNKWVGQPHERIRLFVISSKEALPIAKAIKGNFSKDTFDTQLWTDDVFKISNYTLEDLEREIDHADFAVAIAHADDHTKSRGRKWPAPRDNVIFELGLFMGRLGRRRAILMEPRDEGVKLPSDLAGVTTITYPPLPNYNGLFNRVSTVLGFHIKNVELESAVSNACDRLRKHIYTHGVRP